MSHAVKRGVSILPVRNGVFFSQTSKEEKRQAVICHSVKKFLTDFQLKLIFRCQNIFFNLSNEVFGGQLLIYI